MKVIHVAYNASPYGIGTFLLHILDFHQKSQCKNTQFGIAFHARNENTARFEEIGVPVYCLEEKTARRIQVFFKFVPILKKYDIVNFHTYSPWAFLAAWIVKKKTIYSFHGAFGFKKALRNFLLRHFYRFGINKCCNKLTFATETSKAIYLEKIGNMPSKEKIAIFPYGLQVKKITPNKPAKLVKSMLSADGKIIIGTAARMDPVKRLEFLIEAFSKLSFIENAELWIAGSGDERYKSRLSSLAKRSRIETKVRFLGFREDIYDILNAVDIFVLPSFRETFGLALLEAMALGIPCVAFQDGGGAVDILGDSGFIVRDIADLRRALEVLGSDLDLRSILSKRAKKRALDFDMEYTANNFKKLYAELANEE